ncbi:Rap1a/Tai family immunity protein [Gluconobacter sp. P5B12]|uniref:Rap1a/Tai family immunity protein n=1 Tax=unclassified Gluconobacter TaxID=2644261 RepID=UPI001C03B03E|nr:Rap1a/Tai family immunity protein [Gluconobacter sp. P5B12]
MKLFSAALLAAGLVTVAAAPAHAQRVSKVSGKALGNMCSASKSTALCDAYLAGVMDSEVWSKKYDSYADDAGAPVAFCVPVSETTTQVRGKLISWLHAHNDALTQSGGKAVYRALHDAYPCHTAAEAQK